MEEELYVNIKVNEEGKLNIESNLSISDMNLLLDKVKVQLISDEVVPTEQ